MTDTYVLLHNNAKVSDLEAKFPLLVEKVNEQAATTKAVAGDFSLHLLPVTQMHMNDEIKLGSVSDPRYSYILSGIALLVLIIACINFVNLAIGQSGTRGRSHVFDDCE